MQSLRVSANQRCLITEDGKPFFWLGDTAWRLSALGPDEVDFYMKTRARQAFNVIQVHPGYQQAGFLGNQPFQDGNTEQPNESFWKHIDEIVSKAGEYGLYVALAPLWGQEYAQAFSGESQRARAFGRWIGARYVDHSQVLWIVSGEYDSINDFRLPVSDEQLTMINAVAEGLVDSHHGTQLMTIHPGVIHTSSFDFHHAAWLNFNMLQSGHFIDCEAYGYAENHTLIAHDYELAPRKPVLDGEPIYEDTPDGVWTVKNTDGLRADAAAVRRKAYWSVLAGAFGHTYGHNDVYPFCDPAYPARSSRLPQGPGVHDWRNAIESEGAAQMKHVRFLIESRPCLERIPDPSLVAGRLTGGLDHVAACRAMDGSYAMIYSPRGKPVTVDTRRLSGDRLNVWWYNPRSGVSEPTGQCQRTGEQAFIPPITGEDQDWILLLDDDTRGYLPPERQDGR
jgi:hypothetical protein